MYKILVSDPLEATGLAMLRDSGHEVRELTADERARLPEILPDYDALVVRSGTRVTRELLQHGDRLKVVGRAGIGVDNVDIAAATERGILVVNAPTANLISATEHTFALLLALARNVAAADRALKEERWDRKAFVGSELQRKSLGIIGFGRIGQQVARRARAFDMEVLAFDPFLPDDVVRRHDAEPLALDDLLARADVVTLHTPLTDDTRNLLDAARIGRMRSGALLVNCGRGGVVDEAALLAALESGRLAGAALDVFAEEPPTDWRLATHPRVVATPHLGAQTEEAQVRISTETARMVTAALDGSMAITAVNLPFRPTGAAGAPFLRLAESLGQLAGGLVEGKIRGFSLDLWGVDDALQVPLQVAALTGVLRRMHGEAVNYVNAERLAEGSGIGVERTVHAEERAHAHRVEVCVASDGGDIRLAGTLVHGDDPRVVSFGDYPLEFRPKGWLMVVRNRDVPGVVGNLGTTLGNAGLNIAEIHLARRPGAKEAVAVLRLDACPSPEVVRQVQALPEVRTVHALCLPGGPDDAA